MDTASYVISHGPCPACRKKGRDKHGDNLAEYSDGHKFCFGCGFYSPPNKIRSLLHANGEVSKSNLGSFKNNERLSGQFPTDARLWLLRYQITPEVIERYGIKYNEISSRIRFTTPGGRICERQVQNSKASPKWLSIRKGSSNLYEKDCWGYSGSGCITVLVEDVVSGIRVCEATRPQVGGIGPTSGETGIRSYAILGTNIPAKALYSLCRASGGIRVWLDRDKRDKALRIASRASQWNSDVRVIGSELDPKEYSNEEIRRFLEEKA